MTEGTDIYYTIGEAAEGEYREKGSKFLAYAFPVSSEVEVREKLESVRKIHPKARHHVYAYRLHPDGSLYRANDDGEPSGTGGRPILGQIDKRELTNTLIVVARYFGGTLLGASGLIRAYRAGAADALAKARIREKFLAHNYRIGFDYEKMGDLMRVAKSFDAEILAQHFELHPSLDVAVRKSRSEEFLTYLKAVVHGVTQEEAMSLHEIDELTITFLGQK